MVDEANPRCGIAADIVALVAQEAFDDLKAAPQMVTAAAHAGAVLAVLEDAYVPSPRRSPPTDGREWRAATGGRHDATDMSRSWACPSGASR